MTKRELFKCLNDLCNEMNTSYYINCGGCCFVAAVIAEQLEKCNISYLVAITECPTHYAIKVKDRYINRDGFYFRNCYEYDSQYLYNKYESEDWNETYEIQHNSIVKRKIKSVFKKYENSRARFYNGTSRLR